MYRFVTVACLGLALPSFGVAEELPVIRIHANPFEAFQIVSKLKEVSAKIVITPKKVGFVAGGGGINDDQFAETFLDFVVEVRSDMAKKKPKMLELLKQAGNAPEGKRMDATMKVFEEYLEIKVDSKWFFDRACKCYLEWLKRDKRVTIEEGR